MDDKHYLNIAIARAKESAQNGCFPAGAAIVIDWHGQSVQYSAMSGNDLDFRHAELRVIENAIDATKQNVVRGLTLYASMEPCMMCLAAAYWNGISRIVYAIPQSRVNPEYYGSSLSTETINNSLSMPLELVHLDELENVALDILKEWESTANRLISE